MAFNGSGAFVRLYSWAADAAAAIKIRADRMDNEFNGIATGLSTCLTKDGQTTPTDNLPMGGYKHQNIANGASRTEYPSLGQVQDGNINWVDGGGTADAITASYTIPITVLVDGQVCWVRATAANATTTPTFSPSGLTARTIVKNGGAALVAGEISGDGHQLILRYDLPNTRWELLNPKNGFTASSTDTLTNKTIDNTNTIAVKDTLLSIQDDGDATKLFKFELSAQTTGTTVTMTPPNASFTAVGTATTQTLTNKTLGSGTVFPAGMTIQRRIVTYTANATLAATIALDDTIPQNTEGTQILTDSITASKSTNIFRVTFMGWGTNSNGGTGNTIALFLDSGASAVQVSSCVSGAASQGLTFMLQYEVVAGDLASHTFNVRGGCSGSTFRLNGNAVGRYYGGAAATTMIIEEIAT